MLIKCVTKIHIFSINTAYKCVNYKGIFPLCASNTHGTGYSYDHVLGNYEIKQDLSFMLYVCSSSFACLCYSPLVQHGHIGHSSE